MPCLWGFEHHVVTPPLVPYSQNPRVARFGGCHSLTSVASWGVHGFAFDAHPHSGHTLVLRPSRE